MSVASFSSLLQPNLFYMLSITVPPRNEEDSIGKFLDSVRENSFSDYETMAYPRIKL